MNWLFSPNIKVIHGFSTRLGGISTGSFASLNIGGQEDDPIAIQQNRTIALAELSIDPKFMANLRQVHGNQVVIGKPGAQTGDGLVSAEKGVALTISVADCYPILFHDPKNQVIGAAHAGWRGTLSLIATKTIEEMVKLGAHPQFIQVAIGQGISHKNFEVGQEVIEQFRDTGFPETCFTGMHLNLLEANKFLLIKNGIKPENIWAMNRCTFEPDFYSYRRDKGKTGRMWAVIMNETASL